MPCCSPPSCKQLDSACRSTRRLLQSPREQDFHSPHLLLWSSLDLRTIRRHPHPPHCPQGSHWVPEQHHLGQLEGRVYVDLVPGIWEAGNCWLGSREAGNHCGEVGNHYLEAEAADSHWQGIEVADNP